MRCHALRCLAIRCASLLKNMSKENFRLPRRIKKRLKKGFWLYPADEKGNFLMANPTKTQKDYTAIKNGIVKNRFNDSNSRARRKEMMKKLDAEISVPDEDLWKYVNDIFREDLRNSFYNILIRAKKDRKAVKAYYNFVNAYHLYEKGDDSYGNICCLTIDSARILLKPKRTKRKRK